MLSMEVKTWQSRRFRIVLLFRDRLSIRTDDQRCFADFLITQIYVIKAVEFADYLLLCLRCDRNRSMEQIARRWHFAQRRLNRFLCQRGHHRVTRCVGMEPILAELLL